MADLASYDLANINAVVDAIGPFRDLLCMARGAIGVAFVSRLLGGDLGYRLSPIVAIFIKRISCEISFCSVCQHAAGQHKEHESNDMSRHSLPALSYLLNLKVLLAEIFFAPIRRR
jgi:hypothetical protein